MSDTKQRHSARYEVSVGGNTFDDTGGKISDLVVDTTLDGADRFSFTLNTKYDMKEAKFKNVSWDDYKTGTDVTIKAGWGDKELAKLLAGKVQAVKSDFSREKGPLVNISGYGLLHQMTRGINERSWSDEKVGNVADEILGEYFGEKEVKKPGVKRNRIIQHNQNDYQFIKKLADKYGFNFYARKEKAHFKPNDSMGGEDPAATLTYGGRLDSFNGEVNEASKIKEVVVRYYDMNKEKEVTASATDDKAPNEKKEVFRVSCDSKSEAEEVAKSKLSVLSDSSAVGEGECRGIPELTAGASVKIKNMGSKFSKTYYVTKATHRMGSSGYKTSFEATEEPE